MKFKVGIMAGVFLLSTAAAYACHDGAMMDRPVLLNQSLMSIDKNSSCRKHCPKMSEGAACPMKKHMKKLEKTCPRAKAQEEKAEGGCCPSSK